MKHVAIIPARNGSKSIVNKNLQKLRGKSLVQLAIDSALECGKFAEVVVTTDIPVLMDELSMRKEITLINRDPALCTDASLMSNTVLDVLYRTQYSHEDFLWLLQPTSPFRLKSDYEEIDKIIFRHKPASVISVRSIGGEHPDRCYTNIRGQLKPLRYTNFENRQSLKSVYIRNGCFYVCKVGTFKATHTFHIDPCMSYEMPDERSVNIDGPLDLMLAKALVKGAA